MIFKKRDIAAIAGVAIALSASSYLAWSADARIAAIAAIVCAATAVVAVQFALFRRTEAWISDELRRTFRQCESMFYLVSRLRVRESLPPMRDFAISPDFANLLISLIDEFKPDLVMELGSGVSTLVCGYRLEQLGSGSLISLDHDLKYSRQSARRVKAHGLEKYASVCHAPLVENRIGNDSWSWYDLNGITIRDKIDLLIVDGPPTKSKCMNRYPALPMLYRYLSDRAIIVLDDGARKEEQDIVRRWMNEFTDFEAEYHDLEAGAFVLRRKRGE
ncbi:MAG: class I SAM-dependent methyltransferase [Pirellulales bacterium]|nr:class I SAM-dependent methyltransferase [Pirellulales bacterium]